MSSDAPSEVIDLTEDDFDENSKVLVVDALANNANNDNYINPIAPVSDPFSLSKLGLKPAANNMDFTAYDMLREWSSSIRGASDVRTSSGHDTWNISCPLGFSQQPGNWQCGYANCQMVFSALVNSSDVYKAVLGTQTPSIESLQVLIDNAHASGFDYAAYLEIGSLVGTRAWIGCTEVVALYRSFGIPARCIDFESPHACLNATKFAQIYFSFGPQAAMDFASNHPRTFQPPTFRDVHTTRYPLYLQWQGHSITIVGAKLGEMNVLVFDPMSSPHAYAQRFSQCVTRRIPEFDELQICIVGPLDAMSESQVYSVIPDCKNLKDAKSPVAWTIRSTNVKG